eukprot:gnl/MRDRNA2_/MRDRNA2_323787_c0_seq1.p2 gnl/MRDRNA2_/MRDRNA2_323787_c0~~gnl/MRDRNA2_/MRDRNA2_323787_c0_seq1.p2  ORF type:complete len:137 (+),score=13.76 gnl/MRDRNA2_/MRDRNA2_323787_c0_seq1:56-412(+)
MLELDGRTLLFKILALRWTGRTADMVDLSNRSGGHMTDQMTDIVIDRTTDLMTDQIVKDLTTNLMTNRMTDLMTDPIKKDLMTDLMTDQIGALILATEQMIDQKERRIEQINMNQTTG